MEGEVVIKKKSTFRETIEAIVVALLLALFVKAFIVQAFKIPSGSMKNTLLIGDHILVNKFIYGISIPFFDKKLFTRIPKRGDVIVFKYPKDETRDFIKRVIGTPGDKLEIRNQKVYINDHLISEPYAIHKDQPRSAVYGGRRDWYGPIVIPEKNLFVMGDNRENSQDSRFWGFLDVEKVRGLAFTIYWSWNNEEFNVRWSRIGSILK